MTSQEEFIQIVNENIKRNGIEDFMHYLQYESDFFEAPASTKYHGSYHGGLVDHSLNVYYSMLDELRFILGKDWQKRYSLESATIVSLFHDVCKIGRYKTEIRNVKDKESGIWSEKEVFVYDDNYFSMGHAALSLHRIQKYMKLSDTEAQAIYWHMGAYDISQYSDTQNLCRAFSRNTLCFALHRADMTATHICENKEFEPIPIE